MVGRRDMKKSKSRIVFEIINYCVISFLTLSCIIPILNILAYSFSSSQAIIENQVTLWPVEFTLQAYEYVMSSTRFWLSMLVTLERVALGVVMNVVLMKQYKSPSRAGETSRRQGR